jgi:DnaJ-related protein SCJ1
MSRGDLIFEIKQTPHSTFKRIQDNLYATIEISMMEAMNGFTRTLTHLDGTQIEIVKSGSEVV